MFGFFTIFALVSLFKLDFAFLKFLYKNSKWLTGLWMLFKWFWNLEKTYVYKPSKLSGFLALKEQRDIECTYYELIKW